MNIKMTFYILGKMLGMEALLLLLPAFVGLIYQEESAVYFVITAAVMGVLLRKTLRGARHCRPGYGTRSRNIYISDARRVWTSTWRGAWE